MKFLVTFLVLLCSSWTIYAVAIFEDYLAMMEPVLEQKDEITENPLGKEHDDTAQDGGSGESATLQSMSCCDLGELAGQKGFHCNPEYYKRHMQMRNRNRSHNLKLGFHTGEERNHKYSFSLMKQFRKCVGGFGSRFENEFHKCCKYAYMDDGKSHRKTKGRENRRNKQRKTKTSSLHGSTTVTARHSHTDEAKYP
ncbi:uncharacterized protein LOC144435689 [Glandiceps talaboti]